MGIWQRLCINDRRISTSLQTSQTSVASAQSVREFTVLTNSSRPTKLEWNQVFLDLKDLYGQTYVDADYTWVCGVPIACA